MWKYNDTPELSHAGTKGMKWGFNDGGKNGKRTANEKELQKIKEQKAKERGTAQIDAGLKKRSDAPPKEYQPKMKTSTFGKKQGFTDEYGVFYEGTKEQVRQKKYVHDLARAQKRWTINYVNLKKVSIHLKKQ